MKIAFKFLLSLVLALLLAWGIRTYVFTVYSVPEGGLPPQLKEGNRVIVNRIDCDIFSRGETIVFTDSVECLITPKSKYTGREKEGSYVRGWMEANFIGVIEQMPGDTIRMGKERYVIPTICCKRCGCKDCRFYLVRTAKGETIVHKHQIIGKAYKLF